MAFDTLLERLNFELDQLGGRQGREISLFPQYYDQLCLELRQPKIDIVRGYRIHRGPELQSSLTPKEET